MLKTSKNHEEIIEITDKLHAGQKPLFIISSSDFHLINKEQLKKLLPPLTIIRKEKDNIEVEQLKVQSRELSHQLEVGNIKVEKYQQKRNKYFTAQEVDPTHDAKATTRSPRIGTEGCCGKGCNGCLIFWNDEKYSTARAILKTKKIGEMLN